MNDVVVNKVQSIQRCVLRAREEHRDAGGQFLGDYTRQDAAILNITRACEQAIDLANHLIRSEKLGIPTDSGWIPQYRHPRIPGGKRAHRGGSHQDGP